MRERRPCASRDYAAKAFAALYEKIIDKNLQIPYNTNE